MHEGTVKRPSYQWYPGDWKRDTALQSCSWEARSLWRDLLDIMHDGDPYGHLSINGKALQTPQIADMVRLPLPRVRRYLQELIAAGVPSLTGEGVIFSRRMVKDEHIRNVRAAAGKRGGNPNLIGSDLVNQNSNQKPTPAFAVAVASASSSSSSSGEGGETFWEHMGFSAASEMDDTGRSALEGYYRASHDPYRYLAELRAVLAGVHGPGGRAPTPLQLGQALHEMALAGAKPTASILRGFVRRIIDPADPPARAQNGQKPEGDLSGWVARKEAERVAGS
jgi:hypothetical protein